MISKIANAEIRVDVEGGQRIALPIAILSVGDSSLEQIVSNDLENSGYFAPIAKNRYAMRPQNPKQVDVDSFRRIGASYVVLIERINSLQAQFSLIEMGSGTSLLTKTIASADSRFLSHSIADDIFLEITGKQGIAKTKIAYVLEKFNQNPRYSLILSDYDGENQKILLESNQPIVTPVWSHSGNEIAYTTYQNNKSQLVLFNTKNRSRRILQQSSGITSSPAFSVNDQQIAFAQSGKSGLDIYMINKNGGNKIRLTNNQSINTEPFFGKNGRYLYFTSDINTNPKIYQLNLTNGQQSRVSGLPEDSTSSNLSPEGNKLLVNNKDHGSYKIGLFDLDTASFNYITDGRLDENANFAPNGQMIIYSTKQNNRSVLKVINDQGKLAFTISAAGNLIYPIWRPFNNQE